MKKRKWHRGSPPHVGWWNASVGNSPSVWRWWDGAEWSDAAFDDDDSDYAGRVAMVKDHYQEEINWTYYYPKNARVPRIDPRK